MRIPATFNGQVDLSALVARLGDEGILSVMVEGGAAIIASLLHSQLAHYAVVTIAPRYAPGVHVTAPSSQVSAALQNVQYIKAGNDILVWGSLWANKIPVSTRRLRLLVCSHHPPYDRPPYAPFRASISGQSP